MATPKQTLCPGDEDIRVLAAMAVTKEWKLLLSHAVHPKWMRPPQRVVAEDLRTRYINNPQNWPPSFESLIAEYPHIDWPPWLTIQGLSVDKFIADFVAQARSYAAVMVSLTIMAKTRDAISDPSKWEEAMYLCTSSLADLQGIGRASAGAYRVASDVDEAMEIAQGTDRRTSRVVMPSEHQNHLIGRTVPGCYVDFGTAKSAKTMEALRKVVVNAIDRSLPGLYVDIENDRSIILRRLACIVGKLPLNQINRIFHRKDLYEESTGAAGSYLYKGVELELMIAFSEAMQCIHDKGTIHMLDRRTNREMNLNNPSRKHKVFTMEQIVMEAERVGAVWISVDQIHEMVSEGTRGNANFTERVFDNVQVLDLSDRVVFLTTQQNRKNEPLEHEKHFPCKSQVYGSSALAHKGMYLCHLRTIQVSPEEGDDYTDRFGQAKTAQWLRVWTPLLMRTAAHTNTPTTGLEARWFELTNAFDYTRHMNYEEGTDLYETVMARKTVVAVGTKNGAKANGAKPNVATVLPSGFDYYSGKT
jgi:hypothetical protein